MSDDAFTPEYAERINAFARESAKRRAVAKVAEPLLAGLQEGAHHFSPDHFRALVEYLFEGEPGRAAAAIKSDRFDMLTLVFVCDASLVADEPMMTISEFARLRGVIQQTMHARVCKAMLRQYSRFGKKLYRVTELEKLTKG